MILNVPERANESTQPAPSCCAPNFKGLYLGSSACLSNTWRLNPTGTWTFDWRVQGTGSAPIPTCIRMTWSARNVHKTSRSFVLIVPKTNLFQRFLLKSNWCKPSWGLVIRGFFKGSCQTSLMSCDISPFHLVDQCHGIASFLLFSHWPQPFSHHCSCGGVFTFTLLKFWLEIV